MAFALPPNAPSNPASRPVMGASIATIRGTLPVEAIRPGDRVCTVLGADTGLVVWTGRRVVDCARHPDPVQVWPVRIAAHTFGPGIPAADLHVSPDHAVYVDRVLIPVRLLIDGAAIRQELVGRVAYHHIRLAHHDVFLGNGLPVESLASPEPDTRFSHAGGVIALHPDFASRAGHAPVDVPLVSGGRALAAVRKRLAAEAVRRRRPPRGRTVPRVVWPV